MRPCWHTHVDNSKPADIWERLRTIVLLNPWFQRSKALRTFVHDTNIRFLSHLNLFKTYYWFLWDHHYLFQRRQRNIYRWNYMDDSAREIENLAGSRQNMTSRFGPEPRRIGSGARKMRCARMGYLPYAFAEDGRCISLCKIMLTHADERVLYVAIAPTCINRRKAWFTESYFPPLPSWWIHDWVYRRNYDEGSFLSSGVRSKPGLHDGTVGEGHQVDLRLATSLQWIHTWSIPEESTWASQELVNCKWGWALRRSFSVNIEIPNEASGGL